MLPNATVEEGLGRNRRTAEMRQTVAVRTVDLGDQLMGADGPRAGQWLRK
jgi:hypothetical protein